MCALFSSSHPLLTLRAEKETSSPSLVRLVSEITMLGAFSSNHAAASTPEDRKRCTIFHSKNGDSRPRGETHFTSINSARPLFWPLSDIHSTSDTAEQTADHAVTAHTERVRVNGRGGVTRPYPPSPLEAGWRPIRIRKSPTAANTLPSRISAD